LWPLDFIGNAAYHLLRKMLDFSTPRLSSFRY